MKLIANKCKYLLFVYHSEENMPICDYMAICYYCQSAILDNLYYNVYCFIEQREENPVKCYFIIVLVYSNNESD